MSMGVIAVVGMAVSAGVKIHQANKSARAAQAQQEAALNAPDPVVEEDEGTAGPTITRNPIATPVPGGYGGTDPGAINPTGLNI